MSPILLTVLSFGAGVSVIAGAYSIFSDLFLRDRKRVSERVDDEFQRRQRERVQKSSLFKDISQLAADSNFDVDNISGFRHKFEIMIEQSGIDVTAHQVLTITVATGLALGVIGGLLRQSFIVAAIAGLAGFAAPPLYIQLKRKARTEKFLSQLPDAFDLMGRCVRAGQTISQSFQAVADEFPRPIAEEFGYCFEQQNLGLPPEAAMRDLARRVGLVEVRFFVMGLLVQQQTGGNLAELLDNLSSIIRTRYKVRGQVKALTAEGRMQAAVLLALPPALFVIMLLMNPEYASTLFEYPSLIVATLVCEGFGALWIRQIVNFDF